MYLLLYLIISCTALGMATYLLFSSPPPRIPYIIIVIITVIVIISIISSSVGPKTTRVRLCKHARWDDSIFLFGPNETVFRAGRDDNFINVTVPISLCRRPCDFESERDSLQNIHIEPDTVSRRNRYENPFDVFIDVIIIAG